MIKYMKKTKGKMPCVCLPLTSPLQTQITGKFKLQLTFRFYNKYVPLKEVSQTPLAYHNR